MVDYIKKYSISVGLKQSLYLRMQRRYQPGREKCRMWCCSIWGCPIWIDVLANRHHTEMTIVLITVRDDESDIVEGLTLAADEYIINPRRWNAGASGL